MVRIRDVAVRAGVSTTTVSHVLNESRPVSPATRQRVLQAVEELRYRPNLLARSLRRRQSRTIGLLVSDIENPFFTEVARAAETTAYDRGYNVILCNTDEDLAKEMMYVDILVTKQIDGLVLAPAPGDHSFLRSYLEQGLRVVFVNRACADVPAPAVVTDDEEATYHLASRLLEGKTGRIGVILGLEGISTTDARLAGLSRALHERGETLGDAWFFHGQARREGGFAAALALAKLPDPPSAIIAFNSVMLDGVLWGLLETAPHLLQHIQVSGFGCTDVARLCGSARYFVAQPTHKLGQTAATLLTDHLLGRTSWTQERVVLANELVELALKRGSPALAPPGGLV